MILPRDKFGHPYPALRPKPDGSHIVAFTNVQARNSTAIGDDTQVVRVSCDQVCYIKFGGNTVEASAADDDMLLWAGIIYEFACREHKYISAIRSSTNGNLFITEME